MPVASVGRRRFRTSPFMFYLQFPPSNYVVSLCCTRPRADVSLLLPCHVNLLRETSVKRAHSLHDLTKHVEGPLQRWNLQVPHGPTAYTHKP